MSNYNKVLLMGRLTRDPELRYTPQGVPVSEIGLAVNREYTVGTERRKETTFVDITLWRRQAEVVCQYLKKGQPLFVEGHLTFDSWETPDGQKRSKLRVVADNFQFIGARQEGEGGRSFPAEEGGEGEGSGGGYTAPQRRGAFPSPAQSRGESGAAGGPSFGSSSRFQQGSDRVPGALSAVPMPEPDGSAPEESPERPDAGPLGLEDNEIPF